MKLSLIPILLAGALASHGATAQTWGPYNAEFPSASDGLLKKPTQGRIFNGSDFSMSGWFKPAAIGNAKTLIAGLDGGGYICSIDGKFAFCSDSASLLSDVALSAGAWVHLAVSYDERKLTLYANGKVVAQRPGAFKGSAGTQVSMGPRGKSPGAYAGLVAKFIVAGSTLEAKDAGALAAAAPREEFINFETGSPSWPLQLRQMHGQVVPQDAWTLPTSGTPTQAPVAKKPYEGAPMVRIGANQWKLKSWTLQAAPEVKGDAKQVASSGYDTSAWYAATVPGTVLTTLIDRGVYPNPDHGLNNMVIPEKLNKQDYWYRTTFKAPQGYSAGQHLFVTFKGVNYAAAVWVNGTRIGSMKGAFVRGTFDISPYLKPKDNVLAVKVSPPPHPGIPQEESLTGGVGENGGVMAQDGPTFIATEGWDWIRGIL